MEFHEKLYALRKAANMTQSDLAERLNVSRQAVSRWEMGTAKPEVDTLIAMSDLFGVTLDNLLKNKGESSPKEDSELAVSGPRYWRYVPKFWWVFPVIGVVFKLVQYGMIFLVSYFPELVSGIDVWMNQNRTVAVFLNIPAMSLLSSLFFWLTVLCFFWALVRWINAKRS